MTSDSPPFLEGQLDSRILYYDGADCSGNIYHPVEALDAAEAGISGVLGGNIMVGL